MKKIIAVILAVLMIGAMLAACGQATTDTTEAPAETSAPEETTAADTGSDLDYVTGKGTLVVGVTDFEPMDFKDDNGEWIGFDADLAKEFGKYIGVDVTFSEIKWDNKVLELNGKTIDCVWNGMTLTAEVLEAMETSEPYFNNAQVIIVNADAAEQYATADACKGLKFAVEKGSAGKAEAEANGFDFIEVKDQATALMEVSAGTADAAIIDYLMAVAMVGEGTDYAGLTYTASLNAEQYGVGFRKGSELAAKFNEFYKEAMADGTVEEIADLYGLSDALIKE